MLSIAALNFLQPWLLLALLALPAIWMLIRALPPRPKRQLFPPLRLLADVEPTSSPPSATPWWLILLRIMIAAFLILAFAGPFWSPQQNISSGQAIVIIDNSWSSAPDWEQRRATADRLLLGFERQQRNVIFIPLASPPGGWPVDAGPNLFSPQAAAEARRQLRALHPYPWMGDGGTIAQWAGEYLAKTTTEAQSYWIGSAMEDGHAEGRVALAQALAPLGPVTLLKSAPSSLAYFAALSLDGLDFRITLERITIDTAQEYQVEALAADGAVLAKNTAPFARGENRAQLQLSMPPAARQEVARLVINGQSHAGAVYLLDDNAARPLVGLGDSDAAVERPPLQSARFYLSRALTPYAALREGPISALLEAEVTFLILADAARLDPSQEQKLQRWISDGGVLLRFAGPKMAADAQAQTGPDPLLPVLLRPGERAFGGALSWSTPQSLGEFSQNGPFANLALPADITVSRQLLAEPDLDLDAKSWARLADGTPLITGRSEGRGYLVLVHTSADTSWSNLVLSGGFVDILRRLLPLSRRALRGDAMLAVQQVAVDYHLSGYGQLIPPYPQVTAPHAQDLRGGTASAMLPSGIYSAANSSIAVNFALGANRANNLAAGDQFSEITQTVDAQNWGQYDLTLPLLLIALLLALGDIGVTLWLAGLLSLTALRRVLPKTMAGIMCMALALVADDAKAIDERVAIEYAGTLRFACVATQNRNVDSACMEGLTSLAALLRERTAVFAGDPVLVSPEDDTLGLFPILYWPVIKDASLLSPRGIANIKDYLRHSGLIIFDTGMEEAGLQAPPMDGEETRAALLRITGRLDLPALAPLTPKHVMTHSFYILKQFPGRRQGGEVWVEADTEGENGRVSGVIIGAHDWARAWSAQTRLSDFRQQELAKRFGINLVVYALTGTYKADQVHLPALLQRMER